MKQKKSQSKTKVYKLFRVKNLLASSLLLLSTTHSNLLLANDFIEMDWDSIETNQVDVAKKFRAAKKNRGIKNQYIVILKENYVAQKSVSISGNKNFSTQDFKAKAAIKRQIVEEFSGDVIANFNAKVVKKYHNVVSGFVARMDQAEMESLLADKRVAAIEQDQIMRANVVQSGATWGLDRIDQASLPLNTQYSYSQDGAGVNAYIVDTGILTSHAEFEGRASGGADFVGDGRGTTDCNGHGTHVAGTVGSKTYGVAKKVKLIPIRVLGCDGSGTTSGVIGGVEWVAANAVKPAVANMSLGGGASAALDQAVQSAIAAGVTFVVAAGNESTNACNGSPSRTPEAITVGSSTSTDKMSSFSNSGSCVDIFAPGSSITSTWSNGSTNTISGTSMASPHVAGAVALYLQSNPTATPSQATNAIIAAAAQNKLSGIGSSPNLLLQVASSNNNPPPPPPQDNELVNGVARTGLTAVSGKELNFVMKVPAGATNIKFAMSGGTGDGDLYVKYSAAPTNTSYDCRPYSNGNNESCNGTKGGGTYYIRIRAYDSFSGVSLVGSYN